jgi:actin related protein 2/3 complex subunit 5
MSAKVVVKAIGTVPEKDVGAVIDSLTGDEKDVLMKYLYRGLEEAESCNQLLKWHGILTERAGSGCIMRALSESTRL